MKKRNYFFSQRIPSLALLAALTAIGIKIRSHAESAPFEPETKMVEVIAKHDGEVTRFLVTNAELCEVTMTFEMSLQNLKGNVQFPYTLTLPPHAVTEAFTLAPIEPGAKWEFDYTNFYKLGSQSARHDENYVYQLPYAPGDDYKVTQAFNGTFSHKGSNKYAIDWKMPEGTHVRAARSGVVVKTKDNSDKGGSSMKFDLYNNYVLIRHEDGTLGQYCHLHKNGALVKPGQVVKTGDVIALSGNTGFSSGPHLHFCVFKTKNGRERESIPINFCTTENISVALLSGHRYKSPAPITTSVQSAAASRPRASSPATTVQ